MTVEQNRLAVVVVNWKCEELVAETVRALRSQNVLVVDNGTTYPGALSERVGDEVTILRNGENLGYGGGMNTGMRSARTQGYSHALLLNPDILITDDLISVLCEEIGDAAVLGVEQHHCTEEGADLGPYPCAAVLAGPKPKAVALGQGETTDDVDVVTGAAILVSLDWADRVGYIAESYFHYKEEFDFVFRIKGLGGSVKYTSKAILLHRSGGSLPTASPRAEYYRARNEILFVRRHFGSPALLKLPRFWVDCARRSGRSRRNFRAIGLGIGHGLIGRTGQCWVDF